jgi:hypothetical protein
MNNIRATGKTIDLTGLYWYGGGTIFGYWGIGGLLYKIGINLFGGMNSFC